MHNSVGCKAKRIKSQVFAIEILLFEVLNIRAKYRISVELYSVFEHKLICVHFRLINIDSIFWSSIICNINYYSRNQQFLRILAYSILIEINFCVILFKFCVCIYFLLFNYINTMPKAETFMRPAVRKFQFLETVAYIILRYNHKIIH